MSFIVIGAKNRDGQRSEDWVKNAVGQIDNHGNPFEIIELTWKQSPIHRSGDNDKTHGFEDTKISMGKDGLKIEHVRQGGGCIRWLRSLNGVGPFVGRIAKTPFNMVKLAKQYRDGLWTVRDRSIDAELKAMSDKLWESMTEEQRKFNEARIKSSNSLKAEVGMNAPYVAPRKEKPVEEDNSEEKRELFRLRKELEEREARIKDLEKKHGKIAVEKIKAGEAPVAYNRTYTADELRKMNFYEMRKVAKRQFGIPVQPEDKKEPLIEKIMEKQKAPEIVTG